ncbi:MAG: hypothetical protein FJ217_09735 [Ignavibacteria bacterium]|nr:hypothetical protein [Ignavibacteria bacterium]
MPATASSRTYATGTVFLLATAITAVALSQEVTRREVTRTTEKELRVSLEVSFGTVAIGKGDRDKIVVTEYWRDKDEKQQLDMWYDVSNGRGDLDIELTDSKKTRKQDQSWISKEEFRGRKLDHDDRHLTTKFTDAVPIELKVSLGAGEGEFDLSGLKIKRLKISSGASSADLRCDEVNAVPCDEVVIESGVSKFSASGLSNLNFRTLKFRGGVGSYKLDFGGKLLRAATAEIEVGLGAVTVYVPRDMPVRLISDESWFSTLDVDDDFIRVKKSVYETEKFRESANGLTIKIESGLGSVKLRIR